MFQGVSETDSEVGVIPANTQLQTALSVRSATEAQKAHVELSISTPNGTSRHPNSSHTLLDHSTLRKRRNVLLCVGAEVQYMRKIQKQLYRI